MAEQPYPLELTTGANRQDVRVYLDRNDNGRFDLPAELLYAGPAVRNPADVVAVAAEADLVYHRPLRLRVWADAAGTVPFGPCVSPGQGQVKDYAVVVVPNTAPPLARFALTYAQLCHLVGITVANTSTGGATSFAWSFGDGSTSTAAASPWRALPTHSHCQARSGGKPDNGGAGSHSCNMVSSWLSRKGLER